MIHDNRHFVSPIVFSRSISFFLAALGLAACGGYQTRSKLIETAKAPEVYQICRSMFENGNYERATQCYKRFTGRFPLGERAELAQLDLAYAQSKLGDSDEALATVNRFIKTYPTHTNSDYAYYLRGLVNIERQNNLVERLVPEDKPSHDQTTNKQAFLDFGEMLKRFPESEYAPDARLRMVALRTQLAEAEMRVARYYFRRQAYIGAIARAKNVIESYQQTEHSHEALDLMAQSYRALGQEELAADAEKVLKLNAPDYKARNSKRRWWQFGN